MTDQGTNRPRVAFETLGCKLNQYETDAVAAGFQALGWEIVDAAGPAEAYVVNTCTVTNKADRKSRNVLGHHLGLPEKPVVVVTGCFAESSRELLEAREDITFVVPNAAKNQIPAMVDRHFRRGLGVWEIPAADPFGFPVHEKVFHTRASLKIQDGCDNFCTFCIIPSVRGPATSRPLENVLADARNLVAGGRKELVLTGVNMGRWADGVLRFTDLLEAVLALDGSFRVRITSLEPEGLDLRFANLFNHPKLCPHLHLCLQSGSPSVLKTMGRNYTLEQYAETVAILRAARPDLNLTTDIIVGFPGEKEEDYRATRHALEAFGFSYIHVFPFSRRQGTKADRMDQQVPDQVKTQRSRGLAEAAAAQRLEIMKTMVGTTRNVLIETSGESREWVQGLTEDYFQTKIRSNHPWNSFIRVRLESVEIGTGEPAFLAVEV